MSASFRADNSIGTSLFVKESTSNDNSVVVCGLTDKPIGVSQENAQLAPVGSNSTNAAASGDFLKVYLLGDICNIAAGSSGLTHGDFVKPDASGAGITAGSGDYYGGFAMETVAASAYGRIQVMFGKL